MNRTTTHLVQHATSAWALILALALMVMAVVAYLDVSLRTHQRESLLQIEAQRTGQEITSTTLNGNLMGSITLLGLLDSDIKQEASNGLIAQDANVRTTMSIVGNAFGAEGVFVVGEDGIVKSSWDRVNLPSTGLDVRFRPYFQMAQHGQSSVYAAVSMARGDRSLYFAAPVFSEQAPSNSGIGAVVARTNLTLVDRLLQDKYDVALLLSPQGVVFAGSRNDWIGQVAGTLEPQRLQAIRALKQFGRMFDNDTPKLLPVQPRAGVQDLQDSRYAVALAPVEWNDSAGSWSLLLMEDLGRSVPLSATLWRALGAGLLVTVLGWMWLHLLRGRHAQVLASAQLQIYAQEQAEQARFRTELAALSLQLQHSADLAQLAGAFFAGARAMLQAQQGSLYVATEGAQGTRLELAGSAACAVAPAPVLYPGEGLLGQCAVEQKRQLIATPPDGIWNIRSGVGGARVAALLLAPLHMQDGLIGLLELGLAQVPSTQALREIDELVSLLENQLEIHRRARRNTALAAAHEILEVTA